MMMTTARSGFVRGLVAASALLVLAGASLAQDLPRPAVMPSPGNAAVPTPPPQNMAQPPMTMNASDDSYHLGTGDKVRVTVYQETDLSGDFAVDSSGQIQLPLVGQVKAAGLTIHEFVAEVTTALSGGSLKDPKVSVEVLNFRPFYIMGEVNKPGEYPYENGLTVLGAAALAGGFTYRAEDSKVYVRHSNGTEERVPPTTQIGPGDVVRVTERFF
jgi:polysaccharide export outer membrane protein